MEDKYKIIKGKSNSVEHTCNLCALLDKCDYLYNIRGNEEYSTEEEERLIRSCVRITNNTNYYIKLEEDEQ